MPADIPFMPWIDHLHKVGEPIREERGKLLRLAKRAVALEREAIGLRDEVARGQAALLMKAMKHWTLADIQMASEKARFVDPMASALRAQVDDSALRARIHALESMRSMVGTWPIEALQIFDQAGVLAGCERLPEEGKAQALARVLAWWTYVGRPVCERLSVR